MLALDKAFQLAVRLSLQENHCTLKTFCDLIHIILTNNNFTFNGVHYLQIQGTAMGTRMAPLYANIFMDKLEREFLQTHSLCPLVWWRYIDIPDIRYLCNLATR